VIATLPAAENPAIVALVARGGPVRWCVERELPSVEGLATSAPAGGAGAASAAAPAPELADAGAATGADDDRPYVGPAIGSVAKKAWPECVGMGVDDAVAVIEADRPDMLLVQPTREVRQRPPPQQPPREERQGGGGGRCGLELAVQKCGLYLRQGHVPHLAPRDL
jgi:hypothetical protein